MMEIIIWPFWLFKTGSHRKRFCFEKRETRALEWRKSTWSRDASFKRWSYFNL